MNSRKDRLNLLFSAPAGALSPDNEATTPVRVSSGSVRSMKDSFAGIERENEALREAMVSGAAVLDIDPAQIDPAPITDRFADVDGSAFDALKASIARHGQEVPILVRPHPSQPGRYQAAYGHRRLRAVADLGRPVRAVVRPLTDQQLVVAQGLENAARLDLTFIERAMFAARLEDAGHERAIIQDALSIDKAEASKLIAVARHIPNDIIEAIGRAPKVGRGRWLALAEAAREPSATVRMREALVQPGFSAAESDTRFLRVMAAAIAATAIRHPEMDDVRSMSGARLARVQRSKAELRLSFDSREQAGFGAFVIDELPRLFEHYVRTKRDNLSGE